MGKGFYRHIPTYYLVTDATVRMSIIVFGRAQEGGGGGVTQKEVVKECTHRVEEKMRTTNSPDSCHLLYYILLTTQPLYHRLFMGKTSCQIDR